MLPRRSLRNKKRTADTVIKEDDLKSAPPVKKYKSKKKSVEEEFTEDSKEEITSNEEINIEKWQNAKNIYEFSAKKIDGKESSLDDYKGHVCIVVNVASRCGHTKSNYEQFVELFNQYSESKGLRILAFPCNQFGKQEPGDSNKIYEFVKKRNVEFDVFEKIEVNGTNAHPLWKFMKNKIAGPKGNDINWNFTKFIIDKEGNVVERHKPSVKPLQMVEFLDKYW